MALSTADALIYAPGGGSGHLMRACSIADRLADEGLSAVIAARPTAEWVHRSESRFRWIDLAAAAPFLKRGGDTLVVDTFPTGCNGEVLPTDVRRFRHSSFVSRYSRTLRWDDVYRSFTEVIDPYPEGLSEWGKPRASSALPCIETGYLLRRQRPHITFEEKVFCVLDPGRRLAPSVEGAICRAAHRAAYRVQVLRQWDKRISGQRFLLIGAGYHLFYEFLTSGAEFCALPLERRHDDQYRRVEMWGRGVKSLAHLSSWLSEAPLRGALEN